MSKCDTCKHCKKVFIFWGNKYCAYHSLKFGNADVSTCLLYDPKIKEIKK